jgi:hypothetical protein
VDTRSEERRITVLTAAVWAVLFFVESLGFAGFRPEAAVIQAVIAAATGALFAWLFRRGRHNLYRRLGARTAEDHDALFRADRHGELPDALDARRRPPAERAMVTPLERTSQQPRRSCVDFAP